MESVLKISFVFKFYFAGYFIILIILADLYGGLKNFTFLTAGMFTLGFYYVTWIEISNNASRIDFIIQQMIVILLAALIAFL
jgi:hypothetical protein